MGSDLSSEWLNVARAGQASVSAGRNGGFARVTIEVIVNGNKPLLWSTPRVLKISPKRAGELQMTPGLASTLAMFLNDD